MLLAFLVPVGGLPNEDISLLGWSYWDVRQVDAIGFQALSQGEHFRMQQKASFPQIDWEEDLNLSIIPAPWQKQAVFVPGDLVVEQGGKLPYVQIIDDMMMWYTMVYYRCFFFKTGPPTPKKTLRGIYRMSLELGPNIILLLF